MKSSTVACLVKFKKGKFTISTVGFLYKENRDFLVLYNFAPANNKFSWSSKLNFKVIPKKYIKEKSQYLVES